MFAPETVRAAFEEATDVRLQPLETSPNMERLLDANPALRAALPECVLYESPSQSQHRFGGNFSVRIYLDGDWPDRGVDDDGLAWGSDDFGVECTYGSASRANLELEFLSGATPQITPEAEATWDLLISCLRRL